MPLCRAVKGCTNACYRSCSGGSCLEHIFEAADLPNSLARREYGAVVHRDGTGRATAMTLTVEGKRHTYRLGSGGGKPPVDIPAPVVYEAKVRRLHCQV
jgi:hypothetical protein